VKLFIVDSLAKSVWAEQAETLVRKAWQLYQSLGENL
jgi:hypothetical protein